jgi:STE24 endopeptidase
MQSTVLPFLLGFYAVEQGADLGLIGLNLWRASRSRGVPEELDGLLDPEVAERARAYAVAGNKVALCRGVATTAVTLALLLSGVLPWFDRQLDAAVGGSAHLFVAFLALVTGALWLVELPFAAWRTFGVERRFGFSAVGPGRFLLDRLKGWGFSAAVGLPFLYAVHAVMTHGGQAWWLWLFGLLATLQLGLAWLWPAVVAPLFAAQRPLPPGPLRDRLEALAGAAGFRPRAILVEASQQGRLPNAALVGLVRPRILLDEALLARLSAEEVEAVVAHELGHHELHHVPIRLIVSLLGLLLLLLVLSQALAWPALYPAFGFAGPSPHAALALVSMCSGTFLFWLAPLQAWVARRQESAADARAVALIGHPELLGAALLDLAEDALANPWPHPWYVAWRLTHPPLRERLLALAPEADGP